MVKFRLCKASTVYDSKENACFQAMEWLATTARYQRMLDLDRNVVITA